MRIGSFFTLQGLSTHPVGRNDVIGPAGTAYRVQVRFFANGRGKVERLEMELLRGVKDIVFVRH